MIIGQCPVRLLFCCIKLFCGSSWDFYQYTNINLFQADLFKSSSVAYSISSLVEKNICSLPLYSFLRLLHVCLCLCLSVPVSISQSHCLSLCSPFLSVSLCLCFSVPLYSYLCFSVSVSISVWMFLSLSLCHCLYLSIFLSLYVPVSVSVSRCVHVYCAGCAERKSSFYNFL